MSPISSYAGGQAARGPGGMQSLRGCGHRLDPGIADGRLTGPDALIRRVEARSGKRAFPAFRSLLAFSRTGTGPWRGDRRPGTGIRPASAGQSRRSVCGTQPTRQEAPLTVAATRLTASAASSGRRRPADTRQSRRPGLWGTGPGRGPPVGRRTSAWAPASRDGRPGWVERDLRGGPPGRFPHGRQWPRRAIQPDATGCTAGRPADGPRVTGQEIAGGTPRQDPARDGLGRRPVQCREIPRRGVPRPGPPRRGIPLPGLLRRGVPLPGAPAPGGPAPGDAAPGDPAPRGPAPSAPGAPQPLDPAPWDTAPRGIPAAYVTALVARRARVRESPYAGEPFTSPVRDRQSTGKAGRTDARRGPAGRGGRDAALQRPWYEIRQSGRLGAATRPAGPDVARTGHHAARLSRRQADRGRGPSVCRTASARRALSRGWPSALRQPRKRPAPAVGRFRTATGGDRARDRPPGRASREAERQNSPLGIEGIFVGPGGVPDLDDMQHLRGVPLPAGRATWDVCAGAYGGRKIVVGAQPSPTP